MPYTRPGVTLSETATPSTVSLSDTQRVPMYIGRGSETIFVANEAVVRTSTGYVDELAYTSAGVTSLVRVGSQQSLDDYTVTTDYSLSSDNVLWKSTRSIPAAGATYYVTYRYTRPSSDYTTVKWFTDILDVVDDIGDLDADNDVCRIAYIGLKILKLPLVGIVQVPPPYATVDYQDAIDVTAEIARLLSLYVLSTASAVQTYLKNHVRERSLPTNKRERMAYVGAATGTAATGSGSIAALAESLDREEVVVVSPARAKYTYRNTATNAIVEQSEDGAFLAAVVGSYKDSITDPSAPILRHDLSGLNIELYEADRDSYFGETIMDSMGGSGVLVVHLDDGGRILVRDDLTSDNSDVRKSSLNVVIAKHYITRLVRNDLDDTFIGSKILNRVQYALSIKNRMVKLFSLLKAQGIIENFDPSDFTSVVDPDNPTNVLVRYAYLPVYTNKIISGSYYLRTV